MEFIEIGEEKFFWNENSLLEHKESKTTFNDVAEAEKWIEEENEQYLREM